MLTIVLIFRRMCFAAFERRTRKEGAIGDHGGGLRRKPGRPDRTAEAGEGLEPEGARGPDRGDAGPDQQVRTRDLPPAARAPAQAGRGSWGEPGLSDDGPKRRRAPARLPPPGTGR